MKNILLVSAVLCLVVAGFLYVKRAPQEPVSFEDCLQKGFPVMESYPRQCKSKKASFVENIGNALQKADLIILENPKPNDRVGSVILLTGSARGYWFFEATFPIDVLDANSKVIGQGFAQAKGEWMTENFVPFEATVTLKEKPQSSMGTLVLRKDNPSGDPERDDALVVPVFFE